jgi:hypothetical protein
LHSNDGSLEPTEFVLCRKTSYYTLEAESASLLGLQIERGLSLPSCGLNDDSRGPSGGQSGLRRDGSPHGLDSNGCLDDIQAFLILIGSQEASRQRLD